MAVRAFNPSFDPSSSQPESLRGIFESPELPHIEVTVMDARSALGLDRFGLGPARGHGPKS